MNYNSGFRTVLALKEERKTKNKKFMKKVYAFIVALGVIIGGLCLFIQ